MYKKLKCDKCNRSRIKDSQYCKNHNKRETLKQFISEYKNTHICSCGESRPAALQFHHRNPEEKRFNISSALRMRYSVNAVKKEIEKCDVVCANCHLVLHDKTKPAT